MNMNQHSRLSVAPMMDWTDRHCRYFHRMMTRETLLYTEMVTASAVIHGNAAWLLAYDAAEHPVALQLGGSDPADLAEAVRRVAPYGYDEINLNVGCPSDRVQSGCFGAVLMRDPDLVADCVKAMQDTSPVEVTVKCRIGVDDQEPEEALPRFLEAMAEAGIRRVTVHARKAWLQGLSPKQNRDVPPLNYPLVHRVKARFPELHLSINGGITTLEAALAQLEAGLDGVMIGRAAYYMPADILLSADERIFGAVAIQRGAEDVARAMLPYIEAHLSTGGRLNQITRHMLGLFAGRPGARHWKRVLSEEAHRDGAGPEVVERALSGVIELAA
ncbi:tRNA dihydrouridine(20/20a) synthase DusA [Gymnodinialimonas sp. 2305UL16-5]|uniref:tRNA dihydrouridine(20/20a) synthase DusA n=1 Tax=Gymnodinialimonas mytili TaxID=3126503 RepID=UPI0030AC8DD6